MKKLLFQSFLALFLLGLAGCGGTKILKEPEALALTKPLATASDQKLRASLDWVIFRDGPGTWAKNVDWDEYLIRVRNLGSGSLQITGIIVVDSLGNRVMPGLDRRQLVKGTRETKRRYKGEGIKVKAGLSAEVLVLNGALTATTFPGIGAAAGAGALGGGAAAAAAAVVVLVPALTIGGVIRAVNNDKVNDQIETRQTLSPVSLRAREKKSLDVFFPLAPSPERVELTYVDSRGTHTLIIDTQTALAGLHLEQVTE